MAWIWFGLFVFSVAVLLVTYRELAARRMASGLYKSEIDQLNTSLDFWRMNYQAMEARCRELEAEQAERAQGHEAELMMIARTTEQLFAPSSRRRDD